MPVADPGLMKQVHLLNCSLWSFTLASSSYNSSLFCLQLFCAFTFVVVVAAAAAAAAAVALTAHSRAFFNYPLQAFLLLKGGM